jgi:C4-dicarboxylate-specific signal transduction histidine kinase
VDINEIIREVLLLTAYESNRRHVAVITRLENYLPALLGDRVQLQQVMLNLIMNSLDAMNATDRTRELRIESSRNADSLLIKVEDSGHGWDPQHSNSIFFEPFFTTKKDGIGMGLTISRSIIEAHGGRLWAERANATGSHSPPFPAYRG